MKLYVVRHAATQNLLPTEFNKGGTYWRGEAGKAPRVFHSYKAAHAFVIHWAKGEAHYHVPSPLSFDDDEGSAYLDYRDQGRSRSDLIICEAELVIYPDWAEPGSLWHNFRSKK